MANLVASGQESKIDSDASSVILTYMFTLKAPGTTASHPNETGFTLPLDRQSGWQHPPTLLVAAPEPHLFYNVLKRSIDVSLSLLLLLLSLPLLVTACALIVLLTRQNPILLQPRSGHLGREFSMLKLRTMRGAEGAECREPELEDDVLVGKTMDDDRVTAVGRFLRRTSVDELPQLLNVLAGQMSLVGPRPGLPVELARYPRSWRRRLTVKPGLTGLWQVSGRSEVPAWRRTAMDRYYIRKRSIAFDCLILLRTVAATLSMRGAW